MTCSEPQPFSGIFREFDEGPSSTFIGFKVGMLETLAHQVINRI